jgi:hypothetical protein
MEQFERSFHVIATSVTDNGSLTTITEVVQGSDGQNKLSRSSTSHNTDNISLDVTVLSASHLLHFGDTFSKRSHCLMPVENDKLKVDLFSSNNVNAPSEVVIKEVLVPMMKDFRCKEL